MQPIQEAPRGKKYVRCSCNCLLVCKVSSQRIACPRPNCKQVITLRSNQSDLPTYIDSGRSEVLCAHCRRMFLVCNNFPSFLNDVPRLNCSFNLFAVQRIGKCLSKMSSLPESVSVKKVKFIKIIEGILMNSVFPDHLSDVNSLEGGGCFIYSSVEYWCYSCWSRF